jgi:DNA ligase-1
MATSDSNSRLHTIYEKTMYDSGVKGETRVWKIYVQSESSNVTDSSDMTPATIIREHGVLDGAMTRTSRVITTGKNIGKSNQTSPIQQAISEAESVVTKKMREGYKEDIMARGETHVILPMLAQDWTKIRWKPSPPLFAQPKLDGVRMVVVKNGDGSITMTTRQGKDIHFMNHIRDCIGSVLPIGWVLDGELFCTTKSFEEITGIVRKSVVEHTNPEDIRAIEYHVFDMFMIGREDVPFTTRKEYMVSLEKALSMAMAMATTAECPVKIVPTYLLTKEEDIETIHSRMNEEGHEGTIYRVPSGLYAPRARSKDLLKRKDFMTEEYRIVDYTEADGRDIGTVIWVVETTSGGSRFNVRP